MPLLLTNLQGEGGGDVGLEEEVAGEDGDHFCRFGIWGWVHGGSFGGGGGRF